MRLKRARGELLLGLVKRWLASFFGPRKLHLPFGPDALGETPPVRAEEGERRKVFHFAVFREEDARSLAWTGISVVTM